MHAERARVKGGTHLHDCVRHAIMSPRLHLLSQEVKWINQVATHNYRAINNKTLCCCLHNSHNCRNDSSRKIVFITISIIQHLAVNRICMLFYGCSDNSLLVMYLFPEVFWDNSEDQGPSPSLSWRRQRGQLALIDHMINSCGGINMLTAIWEQGINLQ